jgi:hypothetical protein
MSKSSFTIFKLAFEGLHQCFIFQAFDLVIVAFFWLKKTMVFKYFP